LNHRASKQEEIIKNLVELFFFVFTLYFILTIIRIPIYLINQPIRIPVFNFILGIACAFFSFIFLVVLREYWVSARALKRAKEIIKSSIPCPEEVDRSSKEIAQQLNINPPLVVVSGNYHSVGSLGWTEELSTIILPSELLQIADESEIRAILAHELWHVKKDASFRAVSNFNIPFTEGILSLTGLMLISSIESISYILPDILLSSTPQESMRWLTSITLGMILSFYMIFLLFLIFNWGEANYILTRSSRLLSATTFSAWTACYLADFYAATITNVGTVRSSIKKVSLHLPIILAVRELFSGKRGKSSARKTFETTYSTLQPSKWSELFKIQYRTRKSLTPYMKVAYSPPISYRLKMLKLFDFLIDKSISFNILRPDFYITRKYHQIDPLLSEYDQINERIKEDVIYYMKNMHHEFNIKLCASILNISEVEVFIIFLTMLSSDVIEIIYPSFL